MNRIITILLLLFTTTYNDPCLDSIAIATYRLIVPDSIRLENFASVLVKCDSFNVAAGNWHDDRYEIILYYDNIIFYSTGFNSNPFGVYGFTVFQGNRGCLEIGMSKGAFLRRYSENVIEPGISQNKYIMEYNVFDDNQRRYDVVLIFENDTLAQIFSYRSYITETRNIEPQSHKGTKKEKEILFEKGNGITP